MTDPDPSLYLRPTVIGGETVPDDFGVIRDGRHIGRIRWTSERTGHKLCWDWNVNVPLPIPTWARGQAGSLPAAKAAFAEAWSQFFTRLTPDDIEHWHRHQDAAAERLRK